MALMNCPECDLQVSDKALFCPHCGFPLKNDGIYQDVCGFLMVLDVSRKLRVKI